MDLNAEIIVVDNNSNDDSCQMVRARFPDVILLQNPENVGFAKANNQGVRKAKGKFICILNPDTVVAKNTFEELLNLILTKSNVGLIGVRLIDGKAIYLPESKRNVPTPLVSLGRITKVKGKNMKPYYATHILDTGNGEVDILVGAFMFGERKKYLDVGGFDEDYFMYGEDIDLSYKFLQSGFQNFYIGQIACIHFKGESTIRNKEYVKRFYGAMEIFYKKHFYKNRMITACVVMAVKFFSVLFSFKKYEVTNHQPGNYYFLSKDLSGFEKLRNVLPAKVHRLEVIPDKISNKGKVEFIFDQGYMDFSEIIKCMQTLSAINVTFKIRPRECSYIIGSNSSHERGEVISF